MNVGSEHPLVKRLESIAELSVAEKEAVLHLPMRIKDVEADRDFVREGDRPSECCLMLEGVACRYKTSADGKRQIMSFHISGEMPDLQSLYIKVMDHSLRTLTRCKLGFIPHSAFEAMFDQQPRLMRVFWRETLIDASIFREWMVNVGVRDAESRLAHILCELYLRHEAVGLVEDHSFDFPITQNELGDAVGFSTVHVNRMLQNLRAMNLIELTGRRLKVLDWEGLKEVGEFDALYLHQQTTAS